MPNIFLISDSHFGHENSWKQFKLADGTTPLRPFTSTEEMDETMIDNWNRVVRPKDKVYHLGDVVINRRYLKLLSRLSGDKVLIKGNHDIFGLEYLDYFRDIRGYHVMDNMLMCHIPVHPLSKGRFKANIHGHLHANNIDDPWYFNVSVEQINYTPMEFEEIRTIINGRLAEG